MDRARLLHLDRCRRPQCFARGLLPLVWFSLLDTDPEGPAHGLRLTVPDSLSSRLISYFTARPLLVEVDTGPVTICLTCICPYPALHDDLMDHLCTVYNSRH